MIFRYVFIATLFLLIVFNVANAQSFSLKGTVRDSHTQEPVSYASVYLSSSGMGVVTDSIGSFSFHSNILVTDTLVVSYVGYAIFKMPVSQLNYSLPIDIPLSRGKANTEVVIKTSVNKGLFLWRKIMSKKQLYNRYNLANFGYEAYNKLEIEIHNFNVNKLKNNILLKPLSFIIKPLAEITEAEDFVAGYIIENISDYAFQKSPDKLFENIKASNTRGFLPESMSKYLGVMNQNVNLYSNYIIVMGKEFVSPFNDNADNFYSFSVPDTQLVNGTKIFHFVFKPRHAGQNVFTGDAWVMGGTFQVQKISLFLGKDANVNYLDRLSVFQEFLLINDSMIFLSRDKFFADFKVFGKKSLYLTGRKTTSYKNIVINSDSITAVFKNQSVGELVTTDSGFTKKTDSSWNAMRHDSLSNHEKAIYATIDKLMHDPRYKKLQQNFTFLGSGYKTFGNIEVGKWFSLISSNQWEGTRFRLDIGTNTGFHKNIYLHSYLAYGTKDQKIKGQAEGYWIIKRNPNWLRLHISYSDDVDNGINQYGKISADNVFSLAIRKPNSTRKFLQAKDIRFEVFKEWGKGFSTELFVSQQKYTPLQNLPLKNNFTVEKGEGLNNFELAIKFRFGYLEQFVVGDFFRYPVSSKYPVAELLIAKGSPGVFNSAYNYTKYLATIKDFMKISPYGTLTYKVYAGKLHGTLPFTFLENHPGNDLYYYSPAAFNLMYRFEYISDTYAGVNIEHNIGSGLFRFIPLTRKLKW
ncbi:MAG: DUF5686 family protein, partial [Chitinophagaceae bacterium]